jgi:hypothetical protein
LDGQQRRTSIYRALKGVDKIYFIFKKPDELPAPGKDINGIDDVIQGITNENDNGELCIPIHDLYSCLKENWREKRIREEILDSAMKLCTNLDLNNSEIIERYFDLLLTVKKLFTMLITDKTLLAVFMLDMDLEKFCMFFERSNSKGISLNFIDIITAKIYIGFNLKKNIDVFRNKYTAELDDGIIECFVRYICYIKSGKVDKKTILSEVDYHDFVDNWDEISLLYQRTYNFLMSERLLVGFNWLPYDTMLIPMMHFLKNLPSKDYSQRTEKQDKLLKFWFWGSLLNGRYGGGMAGSTNDIVVEDCNNLGELAIRSTISKEFFNKFKFNFKYDDIIEIDSRGAKFNCLMSIIHYKNELKDWVNNGNIDFTEKFDVHHIFPDDYIENKFGRDSIEYDCVDSILNKAIIGKITNIKFKNKAPSEYLSEITNKNTQLIQSMGTQLIPNPQDLIDGNYDNSFLKFLKDRYACLYSILEMQILDLRDDLVSQL